MRVERIPTFSDNYSYLIADPATNEAAIVDAPEEDPVVRRVEALGVRVTRILSTHHHPDHSMANPALAARYGAPVFGHASDAQRLPGFTDGLEEGDRVRVGRLEAEILFIPAHTRGHIAYVFDGAVFCGDTLFAAGCGRLFEGTPAMMHEALNRKLARLPDETRVYCGHEYTEGNLRFALHVEPDNVALQRKLEWTRARRARAAADWHDALDDEMTIPSTIGEERATNPFMRADQPALRKAIEREYGDCPEDPAEVLGRLRALKDRF
ncbi:MAG: hydroxyacylglutathione hydrolase [Myxococcota bacterium]